MARTPARAGYSPRSRIDKLGVKQGMRVSVLAVDDPGFLPELRHRTGDISEGRAGRGRDLIVLGATREADLARLETLKAATVLPTAAVQQGPDGAFVYVVGGEDRVAVRPVAVAQQDDRIAVIGSGVKAGETVVTTGFARLRDGSHKIVQITEVTGMEGENIVMQDVFKFEDRGERDGKVEGDFVSSGLRPAYDERLKTRGFNLPATMFMRRDAPRSLGRR